MMWRLYIYIIPSGVELSRDAKRRVIRSAISQWHERVPIWISGILLLALVHASVWIAGLLGVPQDREMPVVLGTVAFSFAIGFALSPYAGLRRSVYCRLREHGYDLCPRCGYPREGLAADALCPECGADPVAESWETATISVLERLRFHHIPPQLHIPYETRRSIMRAAWYQLRQDNGAFALYALSFILLLVALFSSVAIGAWAVLGLLGTGGLYALMEKRLLGVQVRLQLRERGLMTVPQPGQTPGSA